MRGSAAWFGLVALLACHATVPPPAASSAPLPDVAPSSTSETDALCGEHWRWDGSRCVEMPAGEGRPLNGKAASGDLRIEELAPGSGREAASGDTVKVHYKGTLVDGTVFDSSSGREPLEFRLGSGMVVKGFDRGVTGMKVGGKRRVRIPPQLAYGAHGQPPTIPPNATLVFEIELVELK